MSNVSHLGVREPVFSLCTHKSSCLSPFSFIHCSYFAHTDLPYPQPVSNAQCIRKQWGGTAPPQGSWACSWEPCYRSCEQGPHQQGGEMQIGKSRSGSGPETVIRVRQIRNEAVWWQARQPSQWVWIKVKTRCWHICLHSCEPQHKSSSPGTGGAGPHLWPPLQQFLLVKKLTLGSDS